MSIVLIVNQLKALLADQKISSSEYYFLQDDLMAVESIIQSKDRLIERLADALSSASYNVS
jgi:hypothetical protein